MIPMTVWALRSGSSDELSMSFSERATMMMVVKSTKMKQSVCTLM
jgi:hypothetical protein